MRAGRRGFTLMEVMVAVAILGLALTMILAAQGGALASAAHTRNLSVATGLVRCKMTEIEDHLQRDGFQELDESDNGVCCEGDETPNMSSPSTMRTSTSPFIFMRMIMPPTSMATPRATSNTPVIAPASSPTLTNVTELLSAVILPSPSSLLMCSFRA